MQWFEEGKTWQNGLLATGLVNASADTLIKAKRWAASARDLGFEDEAMLSDEILNFDNSAIHRVELFAELLIRQDIILKIYEIDEIKKTGSHEEH